MVQWRLETGTWRAVHPGVYRVEGVPVTWEQRVLAACLATCGIASHRSAARLWGLDGPVSDRVEVTVEGTGHRGLKELEIHHARTLTRSVRQGIPCTTVVRTLLDLASTLPPLQLEAALDSALREGLASVDYLERKLATQGHRGGAALRAVVAARRSTAPADSSRELQLAALGPGSS
jgi:hypothetical protein